MVYNSKKFGFSHLIAGLLGLASWHISWHNAMILSTHILGIANNTVSLSGVVTSLNNKESNRTKFSANISTFFLADLLLDNLFWDKNRYRSLK